MRKDLQAMLTGVLDALSQAALVVTRDGEILLRNANADSMLPQGDRIEIVLDLGSSQEINWTAEMNALADGAPPVVHRNVRISGPAGRQLAVDVTVRPLHCGIKAGKLSDGACVLVLVEDVSSRISMERRLAAGERLAATGSVAAKVAHELNNPLDGVMRYLGLAERSSGSEVARYLTAAREGLMRMAQIIRGLLDQGRPWQMAGERTGVQHLLDEAVSVMQPRANSLGVTVICDFDDRVQGLVEGSVFQVFCNIIKNALDAMPTGGRLTISLAPARKGCEVLFADSGCGMSADQAERIFEPFYTTKPPGEGSGLGLTLCREILQHLGGSIGAECNPGGGAIFRVQLPLRPTCPPAGPDKKEE